MTVPAGADAVLVALAGAVVLAFLRDARAIRIGGVLVALVCFLLLLRWMLIGAAGPDAPALPLAALTGFVALTASLLGRGERRPAALQAAFLGASLLALLADDVVLTWLGAFGGAAAMVAGGRGRGLLLPLLLAVLGTFLLALAVRPALGTSLTVPWSALAAAAPRGNATLLGLAFCFLLVGYGAVAGLVPLHLWTLEAAGDPLAVPYGNIGLLVLLRMRLLLAADPGATDLGPLLLGLGLLSVLGAAVAVWRREETRQLLAWIGIGQAGLAAVAFGLGGAGAAFAGVLQLMLRTLTLTACLQALLAAGRLKGDLSFARIGGLLASHRRLAVALGAALITAAAIPPSGLFGSEFLVVTDTLASLKPLALPLGLGLLGLAIGILAALHRLCLGAATPDRGAAPDRTVLGVIWLHLALVLLLGLALPGAVSAWLQRGIAG